jgi:uncharacterized Tic20 family protein
MQHSLRTHLRALRHCAAWSLLLLAAGLLLAPGAGAALGGLAVWVILRPPTRLTQWLALCAISLAWAATATATLLALPGLDLSPGGAGRITLVAYQLTGAWGTICAALLVLGLGLVAAKAARAYERVLRRYP